MCCRRLRYLRLDDIESQQRESQRKRKICNAICVVVVATVALLSLLVVLDANVSSLVHSEKCQVKVINTSTCLITYPSNVRNYYNSSFDIETCNTNNKYINETFEESIYMCSNASYYVNGKITRCVSKIFKVPLENKLNKAFVVTFLVIATCMSIIFLVELIIIIYNFIFKKEWNYLNSRLIIYFCVACVVDVGLFALWAFTLTALYPN